MRTEPLWKHSAPHTLAQSACKWVHLPENPCRRWGPHRFSGTEQKGEKNLPVPSPASASQGSGSRVRSQAWPRSSLESPLPKRQKTLSKVLGGGGGWGGESCAGPAPPPAPGGSPTSFRRAGLRPQSWLGLDAISAAEQGSLAGSNFLIRTPGLPARWFSALTPLLRNRTPQASPQTTHTHREPHVYQSEGRSWGHHSGAACRREVLAQSHGQGGPKGRSELLTHLLAFYFRPPNPDSWPLLAARGREDTRPRTGKGGWETLSPVEPLGWSPRVTLPRERPEHSAGSKALLVQLRRQQRADGLSGGGPPPPAPGLLRVEGGLGEGGEPRPCEGRLLAPQTHVVGLKKLLGSEALAGVRPALAPGRGRADAEAVSSAPLASSPEGPQDSRRTRGTLTQQESGASPGGAQTGLGPGADSGKSCYRRTVGPHVGDLRRQGRWCGALAGA